MSHPNPTAGSLRPNCSWLCRLLLTWVAVAAASSHADLVNLANGDRFSGRIDAITGSRIVLETDYAGTIVIDREAVASVVTEEPRFVRIGDEDDVAARLDTNASGEQQLVTDAGVRPVGIGDISRATIRSVRAPEALEWTTRADASSTVSRGNTDTDALSFDVESILRQERFRHTAIFKSDNEATQGITTKEQLRTRYELDWFFAEDWFVYGAGEYFTDTLRQVNPRITIGAGLGHEFWNDSLGSLNARAGIDWIDEEIAGVEASNGALSWALDYRRFIFGKQLEFYHNHSLRVISDRDRGELFDSSTGVRLTFAEWWYANFGVDFDYATEPAPGAVKDDLTYSVGIGVRF